MHMSLACSYESAMRIQSRYTAHESRRASNRVVELSGGLHEGYAGDTAAIITILFRPGYDVNTHRHYVLMTACGRSHKLRMVMYASTPQVFWAKTAKSDTRFLVEQRVSLTRNRKCELDLTGA